MLIEKPRCNFKNCKYCFDGNCFSAGKYENCKVTDLHSEIAKLIVDLDNAKSEVAGEIFAEIEKAQKEIVDRMQEFINEWKQYSESTVDYFGGKYEAMEVALRLVKSILTDKNAELKKKYTEEEE